MTISAEEAFQRFYDEVISEPALFGELRAAPDAATLARRAVELGRGRGLEFTETVVLERCKQARRAWLERWLR